MQGVHGAMEWRLQGQCTLYTILYFAMQQKKFVTEFFSSYAGFLTKQNLAARQAAKLFHPKTR